MSSNRLMYDECSYKQALKQSTTPVTHTMDPMRFEHQNKCRMELGIVGGTNVSHNKSSLIDIENELRGQRYPASRCASLKYNPNDKNAINDDLKCSKHKPISKEKVHLKSCQMFSYPSIPRANRD